MKEAFESVFYVHNETVNIWSHIIGVLGFSWWLWATYADKVAAESLAHRIAFVVSTLVTIGAFASSVVYHTFKCHSPHAYNLCLLFDYSGIIFCVLGVTTSSIYIGYHCFPLPRDLYIGIMALLSLALAVSIVIPLFAPPTFHVNWSDVRTKLLTLFACFGFIPLVHWIYLNGLYSTTVALFTWRLLSAYALLGVGFFFWHFKIPERFFIGSFDIWVRFSRRRPSSIVILW